MTKTETIKIQVCYCDKCGKKIPDDEVEVYRAFEIPEVNLCDDCDRERVTCYECEKVILKDENAFYDENTGDYYCPACLLFKKKEVENCLSSINAFLRRHKVE